MVKTHFIIALAALLLLPSAEADTSHLQGLGDIRYHHVTSEIIGRGYHVYVRLPADYNESDGRLPTAYLLDGGNLFPMLAPYYQYIHFGGEVPEMILVGISYGSDTFEGGNFRSTDYTAPSTKRDHYGGAAKFQGFLRDELMPFIEAQYRSDGDARIIFGQSIGGQFVLYTALTDPDLFWGHIASNPALHRNLDFFLEPHAAEDNAGGSKLFVSSAAGDDPVFRVPAQSWIAHWNERRGPWQLQTIDLPGHSHMSAPPAAFRQGLMWLFGEAPATTD